MCIQDDDSPPLTRGVVDRRRQPDHRLVGHWSITPRSTFRSMRETNTSPELEAHGVAEVAAVALVLEFALQDVMRGLAGLTPRP